MAAMFEHLVRVRWRDTDALGHVNHAVFLTYLEEGRMRSTSRPSAAIPATWWSGLKWTCAPRSATQTSR